MTRLACVLSQTLPRSCAIHQVEASIGNLRRLTASDWFALRSEASPSTDLGTQSWCIAPKYISGIAMVSSQRTKYIFSLKVGHFNESILHAQRISTDDLWKITKNINVKAYEMMIFRLSWNKLIAFSLISSFCDVLWGSQEVRKFQADSTSSRAGSPWCYQPETS